MAQPCDSLIKTLRPIPLDSRYTSSCADSLSADEHTLALTTSYLYSDESLSSGTVQIARKPDGALVKMVIAHEIAHAFSYSDLTRNQRLWFVSELGQTDPDVTVPAGFSASTYERRSAEQWARGQGACVGYPDPYPRPQAGCALIEATKTSPR